MKAYNLTIVLLVLISMACSSEQPAGDPIPNVSSGEIIRLEHFPSVHVPARHVDIWLPEDYPQDAPYAVLYMHDGQMVYDSTVTWNGQAWDVDGIASQMMADEDLRPFIVAAIWNGGINRHPEYFPKTAFDLLTEDEKETVSNTLNELGRTEGPFQPTSDLYLKFLTEELKPYIDGRFATSPGRGDTFIMGSSMGGLISMYAITQYPDIFGGAACLSTHWPGIFDIDNNPIPAAFLSYLEGTLPGLANGNRIYFDYGDQTLDALYPPLQQEIDELMRRLGFDEQNWMTFYDVGADHSETAWRNRLHIPLRFLLGN